MHRSDRFIPDLIVCRGLASLDVHKSRIGSDGVDSGIETIRSH
jgi:hypothetical protein